MIREQLATKVANEQLAAIGASSPPTDLEAVARRNGLVILRGVRLPQGVRARLTAATGMIEVADVGPVVERFAIAHELGHALLDHGNDWTCYENPATESMPLAEADVGISFEREANAFAGHLLLPRGWLRASVDGGLNVAELCEQFRVTKPVLFVAIKGAKLINRVSLT